MTASARPNTPIPTIIATTISRRWRVKRQPETRRPRTSPPVSGEAAPAGSAAPPIAVGVARSSGSVLGVSIFLSILSTPCPNSCVEKRLGLGRGLFPVFHETGRAGAGDQDARGRDI